MAARFVLLLTLHRRHEERLAACRVRLMNFPSAPLDLAIFLMEIGFQAISNILETLGRSRSEPQCGDYVLLKIWHLPHSEPQLDAVNRRSQANLHSNVR